MSWKDILVYLDDSRSEETRLALAIDIARRNKAHLIGLYGIMPTALQIAPGLGGSGELEQMQLSAALSEKEHEGATAAEARFTQSLRAAGIGGEWRLLEGAVAELATRHARYADLTILGQTDPDAVGHIPGLPEKILTGAGRPVLLVPYVGEFRTLGQSVLIAWNGTREAARALSDALPLIEQAKSVRVLTIDLPEGEEPFIAAHLTNYLARHGIKPEIEALPGGEITVADALLSRAADFDADLIVMGGYGHSPTREMLLGGVTRSLLQHMTVPVLMSH